MAETDISSHIYSTFPLSQQKLKSRKRISLFCGIFNTYFIELIQYILFYPLYPIFLIFYAAILVLLVPIYHLESKIFYSNSPTKTKGNANANAKTIVIEDVKDVKDGVQKEVEEMEGGKLGEVGNGVDDGEEKLDDHEENEEHENISLDSKGSLTALKCLALRARGWSLGCGPDKYAAKMIWHVSYYPSKAVAGYIMTQIYQLISMIVFCFTGLDFTDGRWLLLSKFKDIRTGTFSMLQARTCWGDDVVETFVAANSRKEVSDVNVVILGAGYDTRLYRLKMEGINVHKYEVDSNATQQEKLRVLKKSGMRKIANASGTQFVPCDFTKETWLHKLQEAGFDVTFPTCIIWEGVTMYLKQTDVEETLRTVATKLPAGSEIGFDYIGSWALTETMLNIMKRAKEPWQFAIKDGTEEDFITTCGLKVVENVRHEEMKRRYIPTFHQGSIKGFLGDYGGYMLAVHE